MGTGHWSWLALASHSTACTHILLQHSLASTCSACTYHAGVEVGAGRVCVAHLLAIVPVSAILNNQALLHRVGHVSFAPVPTLSLERLVQSKPASNKMQGKQGCAL